MYCGMIVVCRLILTTALSTAVSGTLVGNCDDSTQEPSCSLTVLFGRVWLLVSVSAVPDLSGSAARRQ